MGEQMETAALAAFAAACVTVITLKRRAAGPAPSSNLGGPLVPVGNTEHDVRRKAALAFARALDHTSNVKIIQNKSFDIDKTIFHSLTGDFRKAMSVKFGQIPDFSEDRAKEIKAAYSRASKTICPVVNIETSITQFMNEDCDFKMEHADGSFKDHLAFFMDYCNAYYPNHSPRVGLLHSIMGVGTNFFPMTKEKIPKLFSMLTPEEITHIQSFPSILRLVFATNLMQQLTAVYTEKRAGVSLERIDFHRVIDNKRISLSGDDFWVQMNYQLVHLLDFLPCSRWFDQANDHAFVFNFSAVYGLLLAANRLDVKVDLDLPAPDGVMDAKKVGRPDPATLGTMIESWLDLQGKLRVGTRANVKNFSDAIGHSLDYQLIFKSN